MNSMDPAKEPDKLVHIDPVKVAGRLDELGIHQQTLIDAVDYGVQFVLNCTLHDPKAAQGMLAWGKINRGLRDQLKPHAWTFESDRGYEITVHPQRKFAIAVSSGNRKTGKEKPTPKTSGEKGQCTIDAVLHNLQRDFSSVDPSQFEPSEQPMVTWLLLYRVDYDAEEVRSELSLPAGFDSENRVNEWHERIILAAQPFGSPPAVVDDDDDNEIDVDVQRIKTG